MIFLEYPKCTTCQKAKRWLDENNFTYEDRNIKENNPTFDELSEWYKKADCRLKGFLIQADFYINPCSSGTNCPKCPKARCCSCFQPTACL
jgi:arsenate reductase-like glutaredoxin family protein